MTVSVFRAELLERTNGTKEGGRETLPALEREKVLRLGRDQCWPLKEAKM